jgi:hypothetical protein
LGAAVFLLRGRHCPCHPNSLFLGDKLEKIKVYFKPIPKHENSVEILYRDVLVTSFHCPFCGTETISYVNRELEHNVCDHLICAFAEDIILTISDVFLERLKELVPTVTLEQAFEQGHVSWPDNDGSIIKVTTESFCGIVPNALTIRTFNTANGEEVTVSYAPIEVGATPPKPKSPAPKVIH